MSYFLEKSIKVHTFVTYSLSFIETTLNKMFTFKTKHETLKQFKIILSFLSTFNFFCKLFF